MRAQARPRLILPAVLTGPVRVRLDDDPSPVAASENAQASRYSKLPLVVLWIGLCACLYLLSSLPGRNAAPANVSKASVAPAATQPALRPALAALATTATPQPAMQAPPASGPVKPLHERARLEVFGSAPLELGLETQQQLPASAEENSAEEEPAR